jgi:hypothetical protein
VLTGLQLRERTEDVTLARSHEDELNLELLVSKSDLDEAKEGAPVQQRWRGRRGTDREARVALAKTASRADADREAARRELQQQGAELSALKAEKQGLWLGI